MKLFQKIMEQWANLQKIFDSIHHLFLKLKFAGMFVVEDACGFKL